MSQIATSIEQSKRLLAAGLNPESADMHYKNILPWTDKEPKYSAVPSAGSPTEALKWFNNGYTAAGKEPLSLLNFCFPAWSLSRLWDAFGLNILGGWFSLGSHRSEDVIEELVSMLENRYAIKL